MFAPVLFSSTKSYLITRVLWSSHPKAQINQIYLERKKVNSQVQDCLGHKHCSVWYPKSFILLYGSCPPVDANAFQKWKLLQRESLHILYQRKKLLCKNPAHRKEQGRFTPTLWVIHSRPYWYTLLAAELRALWTTWASGSQLIEKTERENGKSPFVVYFLTMLWTKATNNKLLINH